MKTKQLWSVLKGTAVAWSDDNVSRLSAALAYYTALSIAPLLIIVIGVAGIVLGEDAVRGSVATQIQNLVGNDSAEAIQSMIAGARQHSSGVLPTIAGIATLFLGATGVFAELQGALNTIWGVAPKPGRGIVGMLRDRFLSFGMVLGIGFLLLVSLIVSAGLAALGGAMSHYFAGFEWIAHGVTFVVSLGVVTLLFAMIFKLLPDAEIAWADVWIGSFTTSVLFALGKLLIGLYLGKLGGSSSYGAAGSVIVVLLWVYYSAQILLFGAEFTKVSATERGSTIRPARGAISIRPPKDDGPIQRQA